MFNLLKYNIIELNKIYYKYRQYLNDYIRELQNSF